VERAGIRAYVPLTGAGKARPFFSKEEFSYDTEEDLYRCPAGEVLLPRAKKQGKEADGLQGESHHVRGVRTDSGARKYRSMC